MIPVERIDENAAAATQDAVAFDAEEAVIRLMTELRDSPETERHAALVAWARSPMWHPALQFALGWHGEFAQCIRVSGRMRPLYRSHPSHGSSSWGCGASATTWVRSSGHLSN